MDLSFSRLWISAFQDFNWGNVQLVATLAGLQSRIALTQTMATMRHFIVRFSAGQASMIRWRSISIERFRARTASLVMTVNTRIARTRDFYVSINY